MQLIELEGLFAIDAGAPEPLVLSSGADLWLTFCVESEGVPSNAVALRFQQYQKYAFGAPSNETLMHHPYAAFGVRSYSFYELADSDWLKTLEEVDRSHPYHDPQRWRTLKHYVLTFHDDMFECIAAGFEVHSDGRLFYQHLAATLSTGGGA